MNKEIIELCAYHESGKVAYAYRCGYQCEHIELSARDAGGGISKLNGGPDNMSIQQVLSGKSAHDNSAAGNESIEVAKRLMRIYCAGTCAEIFFENDGQITAVTDIEISGQDMRHIDQIQAFLKQQIPGHPTDYPAHVMSQIFSELEKEEQWQMIDVLAKTILKSDDKKIARFYIEDALMKAGFRPVKQEMRQHVGIDIREDKTPRPKLTSSPASPDKEKILDEVLKKFLLTIKKALNEEELEASVDYLKTVFKTFR